MKTNDQRTRPAVVILCGLLLLGVGSAFWLVPKFLSSNAVGESEPVAVVDEPTPPRPIVLPKPLLPPAGGRTPQEWGIEVVGLYPAVGGRVLDLRYKILDTSKAALLPNEPGGIYLMDEGTGITTKLPNSPKTGSIPQNPQKLEAGRNYSLGFPNPEGRFRSGSKVTLVIGNLRAEHLAVR
jgi:hypothetical protein